jgi:hypothetical protein
MLYTLPRIQAAACNASKRTCDLQTTLAINGGTMQIDCGLHVYDHVCALSLCWRCYRYLDLCRFIISVSHMAICLMLAGSSDFDKLGTTIGEVVHA